MSGISGIFDLRSGASLQGSTVTHPESGCEITADARIDYSENSSKERNDAALILDAYLANGESCLDSLLGDFAFAIWDPRENKLFCARDRFGVRPFYYHYAPRKRFVFASDARDIFANPDVPYSINPGRIADFIVQELEWIDLTSTFYSDVYRLPPGHKLTVTPEGMRLSEYWSQEPGPELGMKTDSEFCEAFIEVFSRAVGERLRGDTQSTGAMLSGGMDSGSIVAIANEVLGSRSNKPLPVYSLARTRDAQCQESSRIYATLDHLGIDGVQILANQQDSLTDNLGSSLEEPYDGEFLFLKAIYEAAKSDGVETVLDGAAGDVVFNEGAYITRLLRRGRLGQAWSEVSGVHLFWGRRNALPEYLRHLGSAFTPEFVKELLCPARQRGKAQTFLKASLIDPEFAAQVDILGRFELLFETFAGVSTNDAALERVLKVRPNLTAGRERYARIARSAGITAADPFTDLRVVQFLSRLPDHLCARDGWPKYLLRVALADRLPDRVRWGRGKPHIGGVYNRCFLEHQQSSGALSLDRLRSALEGYIDLGALERAWHAWTDGGDHETVHSSYILSLWLEQTTARPVVKNPGFG